MTEPKFDADKQLVAELIAALEACANKFFFVAMGNVDRESYDMLVAEFMRRQQIARAALKKVRKP